MRIIIIDKFHTNSSQAESSGHAKDLGKSEELIDKWNRDKTARKMKPHITITERLACLEVKNAWE